MESKYGVEIIGWCMDDGPDGKKMRRLLSALFSYLIVIVCWAHQINLVVGDCLAVQRSVMNDINCALDIVKWFNNHGTALELLRQEQVLTFEGLTWALILPVITRWTAHYLALSRVLKLKRPLQLCWTRNEEKLIICAGTKEDLKEKAHQIQEIVKDESFWYRIERVQKILEPLAIAANVTQASHTRLDHVLLTLGNLFRIYSQRPNSYDEDLRTGIIKSLEKRWKKADQDIFIVAIFLNPFIRDTLFKKEFLTEAKLYNIVERVYERILRCSADGNLDFLRAFEDYKRSQGEFSDDNMSLALMKLKFEHSNAPLDLQLIWSRIDKDVDHGQNGLVKLAMRIYTVVANSAGCELVFSNFGITHTKLRNKLDAEKVHKSGVVGMEIKYSVTMVLLGIERSESLERKKAQKQSHRLPTWTWMQRTWISVNMLKI